MKNINVLDRVPSWDRFRPIIFKLSFCISLLSCLALINIEGAPQEITMPDYGMPEELIFIVPPNIYEKPKPRVLPKPPTPKPIVKMIPKVITKIETVKKLVELPVVKELPVTALVKTDLTPTPEPIPEAKVVSTVTPEPEPVAKEPMIFAEHMPIYGNCDIDKLSPAELKECSSQAILDFVYSKLKYPVYARENGIEGTVVVQFVVLEDGNIDGIKIVREIGGGCGNAVKRVIDRMSTWIPGSHGGHPVKVRYSIPVKFELDN